jgi:hypothetical protein
MKPAAKKPSASAQPHKEGETRQTASGNWGAKNKLERKDAGTYIVVNLIVIPFITSTIAAALKWIDTKGKLSPFFIFQLIFAVI